MASEIRLAAPLLLTAQAPPSFLYGGQAVLEGVMFRGQRSLCVAVRLPSGRIASTSRSLPATFNRWRHLPLVRGVLLFLEALILGVWALRLSELLLQGRAQRQESPFLVGGRVVLALALAAALFLVLPRLLVERGPLSHLDGLALSLAEGVLRLAVALAYLSAIGQVAAVRRALAYHGAEHMAAAAFMAGVPLEVARVRAFPRFHPWCGTTVLLTVLVVTTLLFALLEALPLAWALAARLALMPVVAALSFELTFLGGVGGAGVARLLAAPGLWVQRLTTREPTDQQVEVALHALGMALERDRE